MFCNFFFWWTSWSWSLIKYLLSIYLRSQVSVLSTVDETEFTWRNNWPLQKFMAQLLLKYKMFLPCLGACSLIIPRNSRNSETCLSSWSQQLANRICFQSQLFGLYLIFITPPPRKIFSNTTRSCFLLCSFTFSVLDNSRKLIKFSFKKWYTIYKQIFYNFVLIKYSQCIPAYWLEF